MFIFGYLIACIVQGVSKKVSFTELSISRFVTNIISISSQLEAGSPKVQLAKLSFFRHPVDQEDAILLTYRRGEGQH